MNRLFILLASLAFSLQGMALCPSINEDTSTEHTYRPFVEEGKQWIVDDVVWIHYSKIETFYIDGDTLVGNQPCKRLMCHLEDFVNNLDTTYLRFPIYEEDRKVYYFPESEGEGVPSPICLYDFSAAPGDVVTLGGEYENDNGQAEYQIWYRIQRRVNGQLFHGQLAATYDEDITEIDLHADLPFFWWYEGIGSIFHPFVKVMQNDYVGGRLGWLRECRVGDEVIYYNPGHVDLDDIELPSRQPAPSRRYGLNGLPLSEPAKGIYIENGRKWLKR